MTTSPKEEVDLSTDVGGSRREYKMAEAKKKEQVGCSLLCDLHLSRERDGCEPTLWSALRGLSRTVVRTLIISDYCPVGDNMGTHFRDLNPLIGAALLTPTLGSSAAWSLYVNPTPCASLPAPSKGGNPKKELQATIAAIESW